MNTVKDGAANVACLDGERKARKRITRAQSLMRQCRGRLREHLAGAIPGVMDQVDDALFDLSGKADTNTLQRVYFEAMRSVRLCRDAIQVRFLEELELAIEQRMKTAETPAHAGNLPPPSPEAFTLVDPEELEENLAARNIASKIRNVCHEDLFALDRRVALLLGTPNLEGDENPIGPEVLGAAARGAVSVIEATLEIRLLVLKLFDRGLCRAAEQYYTEINDWLVREGVLPDARAGAPRARQRTGTPRRTEPGTTTDGSAAARTATGAPGDLQDGADPATRFQGGARREQMLGVLDQVMRIGGGGGVDGALAHPERVRFIGDLTSLQRDAGAGPADGNLIRELRTSGAVSGVSHEDGLMIDVVAMMFDYILQDRNVGDAMRVLVGRLQIPVLKVAILDKSFFARRTHPARVFINSLAEFGARDEGHGSGPVFERIQALVERILDEFETEVGVFAGAVEELEVILGDDDHTTEENAWATAKVAEERERLGAARRRAEQEVDTRLDGETLPSCVVEFLRRHWRHLMAERLFRNGEDSEEWRAAVVTVDRLLWSVRPKRDKESRDRLLALLPFLLEQLKLGMHEIGLTADTRGPYLRAFSDLHVAALKDPETEPGLPLDAVPAFAPGGPTVDRELDPGARTAGMLRDAVIRANALVWETAEQRPQCQGMGATVVAVKLEGEHLVCAHAGDSRLYRLRDARLVQLSCDHTYRNEVVAKGLASEEEAAGIAGNLITRAVGGDASIDAEVNVHDTRVGDLFLLCSDGLSDMLDDEAIVALMSGDGPGDLDALAAALIEAANAAGGKDNISVGLLRVDRPLPAAGDDPAQDFDACVSVHGATDPGRRRAHNEDAIAVDAARGCLVLADGMGGHNAGEVASAMVVSVLMDALCADPAQFVERASVDRGAETVDFDFGSINAQFWDEAVEDVGNTALYDAVADEVEGIVLATHDDLECFNVDGPDSADVLQENAARDPLLARVLQLHPGVWVEFGDAPGAGQRARLSWVSPEKTRYLFTDRFGQKVSESTAYGLALELRGGRLRVLNVVPLFDRVVNRVSRTLRSEQGEDEVEVA